MKMPKAITLIIIGFLNQNNLSLADNFPNCDLSNLKPVTISIPGAYAVEFNYYNCLAGGGGEYRNTFVGLGYDRNKTFHLPADSAARVEVIVAPSAWGSSTRNAAFETVGQGLNITCSGTTFIGRQCLCHRPNGGQIQCKTTN